MEVKILAALLYFFGLSLRKVYSVMLFIFVYSIVRICEGSAAAMNSAGDCVLSAFISSAITMNSARKISRRS